MSFPAYREYEDTGFDWLQRTPSRWCFGRLRWLAKIYAGGTPDKKNKSFWTGGTVPWLNSGAVNQPLVTEPSAFITEEALQNSSAKWVPRDALVIALAGQGKTKGMVAQIKLNTTCNQSMAAIIPTDRLKPRYLFWWLSSNYQNIRNLSGGDLRDGLNLQLLGTIGCPLPSLCEQHAIASFLDRETSNIDALVAEQRRLIELLKEKRQAVISHAVTKGLDPTVPMKDSGIEWLGKVPEHWSVARLKYVKALTPNSFVDGPFGSNLKSQHFVENGDVYVIESNFATTGVIDIQKLKTITAEHFETVRRSETKGGDIIIAKIGARFGKSFILPSLDKPALVSGNSMKLTLNQEICDVDFINWQLANLKQTGAMDDIVNATAQPALSLDGMNRLPVLLPALDEQQGIVATLRKRLKQFDALLAEVERAISLLQERRTALISAAVTGKIDVRQHAMQETA